MICGVTHESLSFHLCTHSLSIRPRVVNRLVPLNWSAQCNLPVISVRWIGVCCCSPIGCVYPTLSNMALCLSCSSRSLSCVRAGVDQADAGSDAGSRLSHSLPLVQSARLSADRGDAGHHQGQQTEPQSRAFVSAIRRLTQSGHTHGQHCDNVHRQQCAATVASLLSRPPPPQPSVRTLRQPELTPNCGCMHGGVTGSISHAEGECGAIGSGRLEGWPTASERRVRGCQGAMCAKKVGSGHGGLARTISIYTPCKQVGKVSE